MPLLHFCQSMAVFALPSQSGARQLSFAHSVAWFSLFLSFHLNMHLGVCIISRVCGCPHFSPPRKSVSASSQIESHTATALPIRSGPPPSSQQFHFYDSFFCSSVVVGSGLSDSLWHALPSGAVQCNVLLKVQLSCHHHGTSEKSVLSS